MNIGEPKRTIEVEPATIPIPGTVPLPEVVPEVEPDDPARAPA